jgi:hypothetical protein
MKMNRACRSIIYSCFSREIHWLLLTKDALPEIFCFSLWKGIIAGYAFPVLPCRDICARCCQLIRDEYFLIHTDLKLSAYINLRVDGLLC